jgi:hypothetical protein
MISRMSNAQITRHWIAKDSRKEQTAAGAEDEDMRDEA